MDNQNSTGIQDNSTEAKTYTPDDVKELLGLKSIQTYHNRLNFLGIKANKNNGRAFLTQEQFELMQRLDQHIKETGSMDGFIVGSVEPEANAFGELVLANESSDLAAEMPPIQPTEEFQPGIDEQLIRMAAELKTHQLTMTPEIVRSLAAQMTEEDLPEDLRTVVQTARESVAPKFQAAQVASNILSQWRSRQNGTQTTAIA